MRFMSNNVWDCVARLAAMFDEITPHERSPHTGGTIKSRYLASPGFLAATGKVQLLQIMDNKPYSIMLLHLARLFPSATIPKSRPLLTGKSQSSRSGKRSQARRYAAYFRRL
jgi:hypothetical protein